MRPQLGLHKCQPRPSGFYCSSINSVLGVETISLGIIFLGVCVLTSLPTLKLVIVSTALTSVCLSLPLLVCFQLADETGEVQYATQTVTVTDHDAKALGQPVGSTTTVLLTAYPGGHSGSTGQPTEATPLAADQQQSASAASASANASSVAESASQQYLTSQPSAAGNIQVVYSASHMDSMSSGLAPPADVQQTAAGLFSDTSADLAAELIREYSMGSEGLGVAGTGIPEATGNDASKVAMHASSLVKQTENAES